MRTVYMTNGIEECLDLRMVMSIIDVLIQKEKEEEAKGIDKFQIFEFKKNTMTNIQEEPKERKEIKLDYEAEECKVWAIMSFDKSVGEYWTVMYPSEY